MWVMKRGVSGVGAHVGDEEGFVWCRTPLGCTPLHREQKFAEQSKVLKEEIRKLERDR